MQPYIPKLSEPALRWVRFGGLVLALGVLCWLAYFLRTVFTPMLVGAVIAYVLNPAVTWCEKARGAQRLTTVIITFALLGALTLTGGLYVGSRALAQAAQLQSKIDPYVETLGTWVREAGTRAAGSRPASAPAAEVETRADDAQPPAGTGADWWAWAAPLLKQHGAAVARSTLEYSVGFLSNIVNLISLLVLVPMFAFFFLWRFNELIRVIREHLPTAYREGVVYVVTTIDAAVANFFRGRLIVCLIVGALTGIGWTVVGVPYSLLLGLLAGMLNLVPFMSLLALPPALLFAYLGAVEVGVPWVWPVILTMVVYMIVQTIESFLLSPAIEGQASGLHPLTIVIALLIGAQMAGLLGMLLAIPVASTLKTLAAQFVLPELRGLAGQPATETAGGGDASTALVEPQATPAPPASEPDGDHRPG